MKLLLIFNWDWIALPSKDYHFRVKLLFFAKAFIKYSRHGYGACIYVFEETGSAIFDLSRRFCCFVAKTKTISYLICQSRQSA